jgi:ADP-heptose:LPS heptosyltransferase
MPNWLGDFIMALPHLKAMKEHHPNAQLTLIAKPQFKDLIDLFHVADQFLPLPVGAAARFRQLYSKGRKEKPDCQVLFTNSFRGDLEALLIGATRRWGMAYPKKRRPFLTDVHRLDTIKAELNRTHQTTLWEEFLVSFDLIKAISGRPLDVKGVAKKTNKIGIIPGSSNNPKKCWSISNWCRFIQELVQEKPEYEINIYGTPSDDVITKRISEATGLNVRDWTGKTDLKQLALELASCLLVIGNDTGGMHLANAVGASVVVLFGPTNPLVTFPFFDAPKTCMQPEDCPPEGGCSIQSLNPSDVATRLLDFIQSDSGAADERLCGLN